MDFSTVPVPHPPGRVVLLVDDAPDSREMYAQHLRSLGYEVHETADGRHAVGLALATAPDVIVMGLTMPAVAGRKAVERLSVCQETAAIPVVVLITQERREDDACGVAPAGCAAWLAKPCPPNVLAATLSALDLERDERLPRGHTGY